MMLKRRFISLLILNCSVATLTEQTASGAADKETNIKSFDRENTTKLKVESTLFDQNDPSAGSGNNSGSEKKSSPLSPAETAKIKRELERLRGLVDSGRQMLADAEGNKAAQVKILGTLTLLEVEVRKLEDRLRGVNPNGSESTSAGKAESQESEPTRTPASGRSVQPIPAQNFELNYENGEPAK